jgi:hypothetical protein
MKKIPIVWVIFGLALAPLANFAVGQETGNDAVPSVAENNKVVPPGPDKNLTKSEAKKAEKEARKAQREADKKAKKESKEFLKKTKQSGEQAEKAQEQALKDEKAALARADKGTRKTERQQPKLSRQERQFQQEQARLDAQVSEINRLAKVGGVQEDVFRSIWREHSVSTKRLKKQLETYPALGVGDLLVANLISRSTHKSVEDVITSKTSGNNWAVVAKQNKVSVIELIEQTYRVSITARAVANGGDKEG